jgi:hypothetical protein
MVLRIITHHGLALALALCALTACSLSAPSEPGATQPTLVPATQPPTPATQQPVPPTTQPAPQPTTPSAPQRIAFAPGATSAAVEGAVVRGERTVYVLWASAGQQMRVTLSSLEQNGAVVITAPDGQPLPAAEPGADANGWLGTLPATGDYLLEVGPTRGNVTYRLEVSIVTPAASIPISSSDWPTVLANDPALEATQQAGKLYVRVRGQAEGAGGFPALSEVVYGDIDGDGEEEAAVPLFSGGTAGTVGLLVFHPGAGGAELATSLTGYKLYPTISGGQLHVREPLYGSNDPNCCPSGFFTRSYALRGSDLERVGYVEEGVGDAQVLAVRHFYELLAQKDLQGAYAMLATFEQARTPYDSWAAGYANTVAIEASVVPEPSMPNSVRVSLTATDQAPDGSQQVQRFAGTWQLVWSAEAGGWVLGNPQIQPAP